MDSLNGPAWMNPPCRSVRIASAQAIAPGGTVATMPIPRRYTTDAIVLSRFDLGEADRVLTLITPGIGKLKAIAKGVRRPTSRLGGSLEPFAELTVALARGRTFDVVTQVSVGHAWLTLRDSLESTATICVSPTRSTEFRSPNNSSKWT